MLPSNPHEIPLATDFESWYASRKPINVPAQLPTSSPVEISATNANVPARSIPKPELGSAQPQTASHSSTPPAAGFTLFPNLPFELRAKIYKAALPGPRVVRYRLSPDERRLLATPLLHTCRESREEALRHYKPLRSRSCLFYIDPQKDFLYINHPAFFREKRLRLADRATLEKVKQVVLAARNLREHESRMSLQSISHSLVDLKSLSTITVTPCMTYKENHGFGFVDFLKRPTSDMEKGFGPDYLDARDPISRYRSLERRNLMNLYRNVTEVLTAASTRDPSWHVPQIELRLLIEPGKASDETIHTASIIEGA